MYTIPIIQAIVQLFTLCGIVSIRMFLPVFTYFSLLRLALEYPSYAPKTLADMAVRVPEWQISLPFLIIVGSLAILELAAIRNPEIKEFLTSNGGLFFAMEGGDHGASQSKRFTFSGGSDAP